MAIFEQLFTGENFSTFLLTNIVLFMDIASELIYFVVPVWIIMLHYELNCMNEILDRHNTIMIKMIDLQSGINKRIKILEMSQSHESESESVITKL